MLHRLVFFGLVLSGLSVACPISSSKKVYSPNGQWRLWTFSESEYSYHLSHGEVGVWEQTFEDLPTIAAVTDNGAVAFIDKAWQFHLLNEQGSQVQQFTVEQPHIRWSSDLNLWCDSGSWWLETSRGQLFQLSHGGFQELREIPGTLNDEATLRLSIKRRVTIAPDRLKRMSLSPGLLAYRALQGERVHEQELKHDRQWRAVVSGADTALAAVELTSDLFGETDPQLQGGLVVTGVLNGCEEQLVRRLNEGDAGAARLLGRLDASRCLAPLWKACASEDHKMASSAMAAVVEILGEQAAPELCARARTLGCRQELLRYFSDVRYPEVIPTLLEMSPMDGDLRRALAFQARVDFGSDLGVWRRWYASGKSQTAATHPDAPLWLAEQGASPEPVLSGKSRLVHQFPAPGANRLGFHGNELLLLSGRALQSDYAWDIRTGSSTRSLPGELPAFVPAAPQMKFACSRDGSTVVLSGRNEIRVHSSQGVKTLPAAPYIQLDLSPSGRWLAKYNELIDLTDFSSRTVKRASYYARSAFDDQERVLWGWPALPLQPGLRLPVALHPSTADPPSLSPDGSLLVESGSLWDLVSRRAIRLTAKSRHLQTRWSSDSSYFLVLPPQRELTLFRRDGQRVKCWSGVDYHDFCFSPDTRQIAFIDSESNVQVWDLQKMRRLACIPGGGEVDDLCYSPDSSRLAVLRKGVAWIWEPVAHSERLLQPRLASQLWTGRRLENGQSRWLTPSEYGSLLQAWRTTTGRNWP